MVRMRLASRRVVTSAWSGAFRATSSLQTLVVAFVLVVWAAPLWAQVVDPELWGTNGTVQAIARSGNSLYIAGRFDAVGPSTGGGVPLDRVRGAPRRPFARVAGRVTAIAADGSGGWFVGGRFTAVEGVPRSNLAHVLADGSVAPFDPGVAGVGHLVLHPRREFRSPGVDALMLVDNTLYVGGLFTTVCGQTRNNLAAVDATDGALMAWAPDVDGEVRCLAAVGRVVYAGGAFKHASGQMRNHIVALDAASEATAWNPNADGVVHAIGVSGRTMYVGGEFDHVGGQARNSVAALDLGTGTVTPWDAALSPARAYLGSSNWTWPYVEAIAVQGGVVYVGGWFTEAGGLKRNSIVALDGRSARPTEFDANLNAGHESLNSYVNAVAVRGHAVYVGGLFQTIGGRERPNIGAVDAKTGTATTWNPRADDIVEAIALDGPLIYVGGRFSSVYDWQARAGAAAMDLTTGRVTPWSPVIDGEVTALGVIGNSVYLAGLFGGVDGEPRWNIAAVNAGTGSLLPWYPGPLGPLGVWAGPYRLAVHGNTVYVGGYFFGIGGRDRNYVAQLNGTTAEATSWNAYPDGAGTALLPTANAVYIGGGFTYIGGQRQPYLAAVDPVTAATFPRNPRPTGDIHGPVVFALAMSGNTVYAGGLFTNMGGEPRNALAAVDAVTGALRPWAPNPDDLVEAVGASGNTVWVGGRFGTIGGSGRPYLAALDVVTGAPTSWDPRPDGEVSVIVTSGDTLCVGGSFRSISGLPHGGLARVFPTEAAGRQTSAGMASELSTTTSTTWSGSSPIHAIGVIHFTLDAGAPVNLTVFDLQGRRVETLLENEWRPMGAHQLLFRTQAWTPGIYFYRLESAGRSMTRKIVVVR